MTGVAHHTSIGQALKKANLEYYWKASRLVRRLADEDTVVISRTEPPGKKAVDSFINLLIPPFYPQLGPGP